MDLSMNTNPTHNVSSPKCTGIKYVLLVFNPVFKSARKSIKILSTRGPTPDQLESQDLDAQPP